MRTRVPANDERARARTVALAEADASSVETIMNALPDPSELPPGTLVVVPGELAGSRSLAQSVLAALGRRKPIARALRCSALVARGYVDVGAGAPQDEVRADLAWGYAPTEPCSDPR
jgi:hypothetical protein